MSGGPDYGHAFALWRVCREVGALIDGAILRRLGAGFVETPRWPILAARFRAAPRLEAGFWSMGLRAA